MAGGFSATKVPQPMRRIPFSDGAIQFLGGAMRSGREKLLRNVLESEHRSRTRSGCVMCG
jgi:hypothetical protein